jgi:hypothetical protein
MSDAKPDWVKEQLAQNKTRKAVANSVLQLLETWNSLKDKDSKNAAEIVEVFGKLALGHALIKENKNETWIPVQAGAIKVTEIVRVKFNAFDSGSGKEKLNGRRGKVVGVRYGDIIMKSNDDKLPVLDGTHFKPENLEKLV